LPEVGDLMEYPRIELTIPASSSGLAQGPFNLSVALLRGYWPNAPNFRICCISTHLKLIPAAFCIQVPRHAFCTGEGALNPRDCNTGFHLRSRFNDIICNCDNPRSVKYSAFGSSAQNQCYASWFICLSRRPWPSLTCSNLVAKYSTSVWALVPSCCI
jgi:hypothetical protein